MKDRSGRTWWPAAAREWLLCYNTTQKEPSEDWSYYAQNPRVIGMSGSAGLQAQHRGTIYALPGVLHHW